MHRSTTIKSLFLKDESSFCGLSKIAGALHLVNSQNALDCLANELNHIARRARISRETELCSRASAAVLCLPVSRDLRGVAEFYGFLSQQEPVFDTRVVRSELVRQADAARPAFLARVIQEIALTYDGEGNLQEALRYYAEASRAASGTDSLMSFQTTASTAVLRSLGGDNQRALRDLQRLFPVVRSISHAYPEIYYKYANNLAVVLSGAGRIEESRRVIQVALASPLATRFPEWHDTAREIEEAARSEPHRSAPTLKIAAASLPLRHKKQRPLPVKKPRSLPPICIVRFDLTGTEARFRFSSRNVVSLLERYVKTVRIRDRP
jgi:tetratricopeptide (TPR) repeat protein